MNKNFLRLVFISSCVMLISSTAFSQILLQYADPYNRNRDDYIGKYWPANTNLNDAIAMDEKARDANYGNPPMSLFVGCEEQKMRITLYRTMGEDEDLKIRVQKSTMTGEINANEATTIPDHIPIVPGVMYFEYPYRINSVSDAENGSAIRLIFSVLQPNGIYDQPLPSYVNLYTRFTYDIEYSPRTVLYPGYIRLNVKGGSPHIVCSFDGGYTWHDPHQEFTGAFLENAQDAGIIYIKEPNSCLLESIPFGKGSGDIGDPGPVSPVIRPVTMPDIADANVSHPQGVYSVSSTENFVFTIQPTGSNTGLVPVVTTNRMNVPDSEGVKIEENADGSFTVTILRIQQPVAISVDFATGNAYIGNGNIIRTDKGELSIQTAENEMVYIYNTTGILMKSMSVYAGETTYISLPAGIYFIKLSNGNTHKAVIK